MTQVKGNQLKTLMCKNDNCMKLLGYISKEDVQIEGVILINLKCFRCGELSEWRFGYSKLEQQIVMMKETMEKKGGEE